MIHYLAPFFDSERGRRMDELKLPYRVNPDYEKAVAYFSMEYAIDQSLKIYAGGLGYLAGSHMRSAYSLRQKSRRHRDLMEVRLL